MPYKRMMQAASWKKVLVVMFITLGLFFTIASLVLWTKPQFLARWIENAIHKKLQKASEGIYHFTYGELKIDLPNQSFSLTDLGIYTDSVLTTHSPPKVVINFKAKEVSAEHLSILSFFLWNNLKLTQLTINQSTLHVRINPSDSSIVSSNHSSATNPIIRRLLIDQLDFKDASVIVVNPLYTNELQVSVHHAALQLRSINTKIDQLDHSDRLWGAEQFSLQADRVELPSKDHLYTCIADSIHFESLDSVFTMERFRYTPIESKYDFHPKIQVAKPRLDLEFRQISLQGINTNRLVRHREIAIRHLTFQEGNLDFYKDKHYPKPTQSQIGRYPHQLLLKVPFTFSIDSVRLHNTLIRYCELGNTTQKEGCISFDQTQGIIYQITNHPDRITKKLDCHAHLVTQFMNTTPLHAYFNFPLDQKDGRFTCRGVLRNFSIPLVNGFISSLGRVAIPSGHVSDLDFTIEANDYESRIEMNMLYHDLRVNLFKEDKNGNGLKKRKLLMKIVNDVIIEQANPRPKQGARTGKTSIKRESNQPFFTVIWTSIQAAIIQIVTGKND